MIKILSVDSPLPVTVEQLADHLKVDDVDAETDNLTSALQDATEWAESICSCYFRKVTVLYSQYGFSDFTLFPYPIEKPLDADFKYLDIDAVEVPFESVQFVRSLSDKGWKYSFDRTAFTDSVFPSDMSVQIKYKTGVGPDDVSGRVKRAIKLKAGLLYENREDDEAKGIMSLAEEMLYNDRLSYL